MLKKQLNTRLKTAFDDRKNVEQQVKKVDKFYDDAQKTREKVKKNVADIKDLAGKLKKQV